MTYKAFNEAYRFEEKAGFALKDLQVQDVETFLQWNKSLNRYEVGCGKTVISTAVSLISEPQVTVVIMPPILLLGWKRWLERVSERVLMYKGTPPIRKKMTLADKRWVLMSSDIFRRDFERVFAELQGLHVELIVDEAQSIKNVKSKLYTCVGTFSKNRRLQMLTGTPTSKPTDCYTFIKLRSPEIYRSYAHFEQMHVAERDFFGSIKAYQNLPMLAENFAIKSVHRTKKEVHGYSLAPIYPDTSYELDPEHMKLYEKLLEEQLLLLDDGSKIDATTATRLYHAAQQIICNWGHFAGDPTKRSACYDLIDMTIEQTECLDPTKSKLIIWTIYVMTSRSVLKYLKELGYSAVGAYSEVDSAKNVDKFMNDPSVRIGVFQYQSAGAGLNPQFVCSESLHLEIPTSPLYMSQSCGRIDRVGQTVPPTMRFADAQGTIQDSIIKRLAANIDLTDTVEQTKTSLRDVFYGRN
jgi:SNF2 family DNA or RNA helicase